MALSFTTKPFDGLAGALNFVVHGGGMTPLRLLTALAESSEQFAGSQIYHIHTEGPCPHLEGVAKERLAVKSFFVASNIREAVDGGEADYVPVFLSEIPLLFARGAIPVNVALIQVSPPDSHGYCSLGTSVDVTLAAVKAAKYVVAEINPRVPRTHGSGFIHYQEISAAVATDHPLICKTALPPRQTEERIALHIAELVEDGSTLQMGIGGIPAAALAQLRSHRRLGIHTEMFSDSLIDLIECGAVTGENKKIATGKVISSFALGSQRLYDFVNDNPVVEFREASFTNDTAAIRKNPKVIAINSALEIDLTGQVCAESIGTKQYSGVGGQMDFMRGAALSEGGKPIIALPSVTSSGISKISPVLKAGAAVTTTRAHVHYVVTEYGVANLYGKSLRERARALINIAHPEHREALERGARERFHHL